jgi:hypothetical protein
MSYEQEALWIDDLVWHGPSRHLEAWACRLTGQLDTDALEWAVDQVIARHEVLRTRLTERDDEPVQIVTGPDPVRMEKASCPAAALPAELSRIVAEPLDLAEAPVRPWLVSLSPDEFVLVVQFHHAVVDDWSLNVFQRELAHFYTARLRGQAPGLEPLRMQAGEFAVAQRAAGLDPVDLAYWRERVRDAPRSCTVVPTRPGVEALVRQAWDDQVDVLEQMLTAQVTTRANLRPVGRQPFEICPEFGRAVRAAGRALRVTTFTVFASAMATLLWQYGEADEVIFGTPMSLRGPADLDGMIGVLTTMRPLRLTVSPELSFRALTSAAKAEILGAMEHRRVPYPVIARMNTAADASSPCDVTIVFEDMGWEPFALPDVTTEIIRLPARRAKFTVQLGLVARDDGGYAGAWDYDADFFEAGTVARLASRFTELLSRCVAAPDEPLGRVPGSTDGPGRV